MEFLKESPIIFKSSSGIAYFKETFESIPRGTPRRVPKNIS